MKTINKVVRVGVTSDGSAFAKITFADGKLSISGAVGPRKDGDCRGSCGQWCMSYLAEDIKPAPGWTTDRVAQFLLVWDQWHLNDTIAGSPAQETELSQHKAPGYPVSQFEWAQRVLKAANLEPDAGYLHNGKPYSYGTAWFTKEVPAYVISFLESLPDTDITPAWV